MSRARDEPNMVRWNVHLEVAQLERLDKLVVSTGVNRAEHVRRALDQYLDRIDQSATR